MEVSEKDVKFLVKELRSIQATLRVVGQLPRDELDEPVRSWVHNLNELSYNIEDVLDGIMVRREGFEEPAIPDCSKKKGLTNFFNRRNIGTRGPCEIAAAIEGIKRDVRMIAERRPRCTIDSFIRKPVLSADDPHPSAPYHGRTGLVGIEGPRDSLIELLTHEDDVFKQPLKVLSIVGPGGLGKTTLAQAVYDRIQSQFCCRAFILVGRNHELKAVLLDILCQFDKNYMRSSALRLDERQLINMLQELLQNKRYILVIDDLWAINLWKIISCALVDSNCGSRVIITTRLWDVAKMAGFPFIPRPLSPQCSLEFFYEKLFGGKDKCRYDQSTVKVLDKILQKCDGVPLAILLISGLLVGKSIDHWSNIYNSIGFGHEDHYYSENARKILAYSYYALPCYLKPCFLYLSIFPKDYKIMKDTLIWKWIAEGFVQKEPGTGLFELGERYFNELISRSLIQPVETEHPCLIDACKVHDMVLDMIIYWSMEENFVTILESNEQPIPSQTKSRRLAVQIRVLEQENPLANMCAPQVRSFIATMCHVSMMPPLSSFGVIRVLAIEECSFLESYHLKDIGKLLQLRYLGLQGTPICDLPNELGDLIFLQTLDLRATHIEELPGCIGLLRQLRCLRADSIIVSDCIGNLTSLEELYLRISDRSSNVLIDLRKLTELRVLKIAIGRLDESSHKALVESLRNLQKIQVLTIQTERSVVKANWEGYVPSQQLRRLELHILSSRPPAWINSSLVPNLSHLFLFGECAVEAQDVEILGRLPELLALGLSLSGPVILDIMGGGAFPKLRYFTTSAMVMFLEGAMPSLESVEFCIPVRIVKQANFNYDFGLGNLRCLQEVNVQMNCLGARGREVEKAEEALRQLVHVHANRPILDVEKHGKFKDNDDVDEEEGSECSYTERASWLFFTIASFQSCLHAATNMLHGLNRERPPSSRIMQFPFNCSSFSIEMKLILSTYTSECAF